MVINVVFIQVLKLLFFKVSVMLEFFLEVEGDRFLDEIEEIVMFLFMQLFDFFVSEIYYY